MKHLIITRSQWLHRSFQNFESGIANLSYLLNSKGERCCMGFDCHFVYGISDIILYKKGYPSGVGLKHLDNIYFFSKYTLQTHLACVNDRNHNGNYAFINKVSDKEQEEIIIRLYSLAGYKVEFVD